MANWAYTRYALTAGDPDELKDLHERMKRLQDMPEPLKPNGFGTSWLGNLVEDLGTEWGKIYCRGSWENLCLSSDVLTFMTETAWDRCHEVESLLMERYPSIKINFITEESGQGIYVKNDCAFFPEDYIVELGSNDSEYYTESELIEFVSDYLNVDIDDIEQCMKLIDAYNEGLYDEDEKIVIHKFETV